MNHLRDIFGQMSWKCYFCGKMYDYEEVAVYAA